MRYSRICWHPRTQDGCAPQQHWFGPSSDPRSAGIHTPEAIKLCWSSHREIIYDYGPVAKSWQGKGQSKAEGGGSGIEVLGVMR